MRAALFHWWQPGQRICIRPWGSSGQTVKHTSTTVGERGASRAASEVVVQWSIAQLTFVDALMAHAAGSMIRAVLQTQPQAQRESALHLPHTMRDSSLHVPALHSPWTAPSSIVYQQRSECVAEAAAGGWEISHTLWISHSNNSIWPQSISVRQCSVLTTMVLFSCMHDHCW